MTQISDLQVESVQRLVLASDILRTRGGKDAKVSLTWKDYKIMSSLLERMEAVIQKKEFASEEIFKQDLNVLLNLADQGRKMGIFSWKEGGTLSDAIEVFTTPPSVPEPLEEEEESRASTSAPTTAPRKTGKEGVPRIVIHDE